MKKCVLLFLICILCGCNKAQQPQAQAVATAEKSTALPLYYYAEPVKPSPFEPEKGCMSGAMIANDVSINGDMEEFEALTGKSHDVYGIVMKTNAPFPMSWVLDCYTHNKIPMVFLYPQNPNMPFDIISVEIAARTLSTFHIPMIVEFYPDASAYGDAQEYVAFYQEAREIFKRYAPQIAFVWNIAPGLADQGGQYYPGDEYTDWISLSLYANTQTDPITAIQQLSAWCYAWQGHKPLMLKTAVSHYSTETTRYTEQESARLLTALYQEIQRFPRVKCVIYWDENPGSGAPVKAPRENYLITGNRVMLTAYQDAVGGNHFTIQEEINAPQWLKSPFDALEVNGRIYIPVHAVTYELGTAIVAPVRQIDGRQYISQDAFSRYKILKNDEKVYLSPLP